MDSRRSRLELQLGLLLRRAHRRAAQALSRALAPHDIDGRHFGVLMTLSRTDRASQSELIAAVEGDKSTMVRTIDDLEALGYVERHHSTVDRRAQLIVLTESGRAATDEALAAARVVGSSMFRDLDDAELESLVGLLDRFLHTDPG